jgi:hypothetical protein
MNLQQIFRTTFEPGTDLFAILRHLTTSGA